MSNWLAILLAAAVSASAPLTLETELDKGTLTVEFQLQESLPAFLEEALPSGAAVEVNYQVRVRSKRKAWWDKKVWKGDATASAVFDPVTGRYNCGLVLDGVIVASREVESSDEALAWLAHPGIVRFAMPEGLRESSLFIRVRAVFSSSTKWLFFPDTEGTEWVEVPIASVQVGGAEDAPDSTEG